MGVLRHFGREHSQIHLLPIKAAIAIPFQIYVGDRISAFATWRLRSTSSHSCLCLITPRCAAPNGVIFQT